MFHVVTGGSGSGKSAYAEEWICKQRLQTDSRHLYYIATMVPYGKETERKILRHRQMRSGKGFETIECFTDLKQMVQAAPEFSESAQKEGICVLLECMSNLAANELYTDTGAKEQTEATILSGIRALQAKCRGLAVVTNEVFGELPPHTDEMKTYLRVLGTVNQAMTKLADQVTEVVYGIPVEVKKG